MLEVVPLCCYYVQLMNFGEKFKTLNDKLNDNFIIILLVVSAASS